MGVRYRVLYCVRNSRRIRGINKVPELDPRLGCLIGILSHISPFPIFSVGGCDVGTLLGRVDRGSELICFNVWREGGWDGSRYDLFENSDSVSDFLVG